jgi:hypothetical protein
MYKIIGADGKEYGPITADQLRQWLAEGRANSQTRVLPEGATEWKTVAELPEFASPPTGAFAAPGSAPIPGFGLGGDTAAAANQVSGPAIGLIVVAILGFLAQVVGLIWRLGFATMIAKQQAAQPEWINMFSGTLSLVGAFIGIITGILILVGGLKMRKLESHGLAMAASIIAMIPCISPCCLIGLPIGIWSLIVLSKPEVKSAFH